MLDAEPAGPGADEVDPVPEENAEFSQKMDEGAPEEFGMEAQGKIAGLPETHFPGHYCCQQGNGKNSGQRLEKPSPAGGVGLYNQPFSGDTNQRQGNGHLLAVYGQPAADDKTGPAGELTHGERFTTCGSSQPQVQKKSCQVEHGGERTVALDDIGNGVDRQGVAEEYQRDEKAYGIKSMFWLYSPGTGKKTKLAQNQEQQEAVGPVNSDVNQVVSGQPQPMDSIIHDKSKPGDLPAGKKKMLSQIDLVEDNEHFASLWSYAQSERRRLVLALCHKETDSPDFLRLGVIQEKLAGYGIEVSDENLIEDLEFLRELELVKLVGETGGGHYELTIPLMGIDQCQKA